MPYVTPKTWEAFETVENADLAPYVTNLQHWATNLPDVPPQASGPHGTVVIRHAHRWLLYLPDSEDDSPTVSLLRDTTNESITSLEGATDDGKPKWFDLDSLDQLVVGMAYMITDVHFARELATLD